jgi:hypothetical protein
MNVNPYQPPSSSLDPPPAPVPAWSSADVFMPNGARASAATITLAICLIVDAATMFASIQRVRILGQIESGSFSMAAAERSDVLVQVASVFQILSVIGCAVAFCLWFHRAYSNLRALGVPTSFTPGWAPGSFFVPFLNLYRPYQIAKEIWVGSASNSTLAREGLGHGLVGLWWGLYLGSNIISNFAFRFQMDESAASLRTSTIVYIVSDILSIGAALAAMSMIKGIERRQTQRYGEQRGVAGMDPSHQPFGSLPR